MRFIVAAIVALVALYFVDDYFRRGPVFQCGQNRRCANCEALKVEHQLTVIAIGTVYWRGAGLIVILPRSRFRSAANA
jgi:hypothetical protein